VVGVSHDLIASTLASSMEIPSLETTYPKKLDLGGKRIHTFQACQRAFEPLEP